MEVALYEVAVLPGRDPTLPVDADATGSPGDLAAHVWQRCGAAREHFLANLNRLMQQKEETVGKWPEKKALTGHCLISSGHSNGLIDLGWAQALQIAIDPINQLQFVRRINTELGVTIVRDVLELCQYLGSCPQTVPEVRPLGPGLSSDHFR